MSAAFTTVALFNNATSPQFYLRVTPGLVDLQTDPTNKITFVTASAGFPTDFSYFVFSQAVKYRVQLTAVQEASNTAAGVSHRLRFMNLVTNIPAGET